MVSVALVGIAMVYRVDPLALAEVRAVDLSGDLASIRVRVRARARARVRVRVRVGAGRGYW